MDEAKGSTRLRLSGVDYAAEAAPILHGLNLDLAVTRLGVVGRNGSGKSTLARLLAGLIAPTAGTLTLDGIDPYADRRQALARVGILFQNPDHQIIFPTVLEEIAFGLRQQGRRRAEAEAEARTTLARFGKPHWEAAYVNTLSQGQKHLLCLMAVAAMAPGLLILDEPFAGLDIPTRMQLRRHLSLYGGNLIHITHDPADLAGYADCLWLDRGRIRAAGPGPEVLPAYLAAMEESGGADDLADLAG